MPITVHTMSTAETFLSKPPLERLRVYAEQIAADLDAGDYEAADRKELMVHNLLRKLWLDEGPACPLEIAVFAEQLEIIQFRIPRNARYRSWFGEVSPPRPRDRHTWCFACKARLSSEMHDECEECGWLVCRCAACGCSSFLYHDMPPPPSKFKPGDSNNGGS
jgi:hypothetical protein